MRVCKKYMKIGVWLLIILLTLTACKKQNTEDGEEDLSETPDETQTYSVDFGDDEDVFVDVKERYAPGETVELKTYMVMDATPVVTADGKRLSPRSSEDGLYLVYTFAMPDHDVSVTYAITGSDMERRFSITYEGDVFRLVDPVVSALPHDTVTVQIWIIFDVVTEVRVNGKEVQQTYGPNGDCLYYEFEMPEEDVTVQIDSHNISVAESEPILLVDYYETVVATADPDGDAGYSLSLYDDQKEKLLLVEGKRDGTVTNYRVPQDVLVEVLNVIFDARMDDWNDLTDFDSLEGMYYACSFIMDGYTYHVSSDRMPEDGAEAFRSLRTLLSGYLTDEYRE